MPASGEERHHDTVARHGIGHPVADFFDDAGGLVAEQHRQRAGPIAVHDAEVGGADARGLDAHQQFAGRGPIEFTRRCGTGGVRVRGLRTGASELRR